MEYIIKYSKMIKYIIILAFLFFNCEKGELKDTNKIIKPALKCSPDTLKKGDTLIIEMRIPHPEEFAIADPDNNWYYLRYWVSGDSIYSINLLSGKDFINTGSFKFNTSDIKAMRYDNGVGAEQLVFTKKGNYTVVLAKNLDTEPENTLSFEYKIYYSPSGTN